MEKIIWVLFFTFFGVSFTIFSFILGWSLYTGIPSGELFGQLWQVVLRILEYLLVLATFLLGLACFIFGIKEIKAK